MSVPEICAHHKPKFEELGYIEHHDWTEEQIKKGEKQKRCRTCKRFFFPEEMGEANKTEIQ